MDAINAENGARIFPNLRRAMASTSVKDLECYTQIGANVVNDIIVRLKKAKHSDNTPYYVKSLEDLMHQAKTPEYILGVVGATGHGKSTLINTLLGEARLVPTNCMRACTAVITEISWNPSENPKERYIGNIEFISMKEWRYELDQLFSDLVVSSGELAGDSNNTATDAGVAWAKIKAVYPHITKENLASTDAETLANDSTVNRLLGVTKTVCGETAKEFYKEIQVYVDSKRKLSVIRDNNMSRGENGEHNSDSIQDDSDGDVNDDELDSNDGEYVEQRPAVVEQKMELWPLIKVVKIQTKADVLSTGAVIVDLVSLIMHHIVRYIPC